LKSDEYGHRHRTPAGRLRCPSPVRSWPARRDRILHLLHPPAERSHQRPDRRDGYPDTSRHQSDESDGDAVSESDHRAPELRGVLFRHPKHRKRCCPRCHRRIGADGPDRSWNIPLIAPGESHQFIITKDGDSLATTADKLDEALKNRGYELRFEADCEDIFEEEHHFEQEINLHHAVHGRKEGSYEWVETPPEETIADGVDSIDDHLRDVGRLASTLNFEARGILRSHQKDKYLKRIREFGELTVEQLARLSHKNEDVLRQELVVLAEQGVVEFDEEADSVTLAAEK